MAYTSEIEKLERRHRENPEGRTFAPLADAYRKAGDVPRALEILKTGLQLHPDYLSASIVLGRCHLDLGDLTSAETAFRRVLDLDKENVIAIKALADITERQARFDESEHWLNYLLSIDGSNDEARGQLTRLAGVRDQHSRLSAPLEQPAEPEAAEASSEPITAPTPALGELDTVEIPPVAALRPEPIPEPEPSPEPEPEPDAEPEPVIVAEESLEETLSIVKDERAGKTATEFLLEEDPMEGPSAPRSDFDVGVERHEEIVLRPSAASEFQAPSDSELLGGRRSGASPSPSFEEDAPAPERPEEPVEETVDAVGPEDLWQAHPEDATVEEAPVATPEPVAQLGVPEPEPEPEPELESEPEPELETVAPAADLGQPVVTETIGDLYAAQGHHAQALHVYRQLLNRSPGDQRLTEKIEELESRRSAAPAPIKGFAATETGGQSVRSYFGDLLSARLPDSNGSPAPAAPSPASEPASTGFMEEAFQTDEEAPVSGEPTRPASGPLSLSAIFGEDPSPVPPVVSGQEPEETKPQASHFDEFFGDRPSAQSTTTRSRSVRLDTDQDDLEQFHKWLKGLKR